MAAERKLHPSCLFLYASSKSPSLVTGAVRPRTRARKLRLLRRPLAFKGAMT